MSTPGPAAAAWATMTRANFDTPPTAPRNSTVLLIVTPMSPVIVRPPLTKTAPEYVPAPIVRLSPGPITSAASTSPPQARSPAPHAPSPGLAV